MTEIKSCLRDLLLKELRTTTLVAVAREAGIDRSCLELFKNRQRDLSQENIDKLREYFGLGLALLRKQSVATRPSKFDLAKAITESMNKSRPGGRE